MTTRAPLVPEDEFVEKNVVVTGAAGVVGGWIADAFARSGARLFLSDLDGSRLAEAARTGRWQGASRVELVPADLRDPTAIDELCSSVEQACGAPDILVNNAGLYPHCGLLDLELGEWQEVMDVNVTAPFLLLRNMARLMVGRGAGGAVVNIASGASVTVAPGGVAYSTSKAALAMLTRGAAVELAPHGIRVNALGPGFSPGSVVSVLDDDYVQAMASRIPLRRTAGPDDAASGVLFLCSRAASFVTGALLHMDGGRTAGPG